MTSQEQASEFKEKGNAFLKANELDEALAAYSKAIELDPSNHVYYSNRSAVWYKQDNGEKALEDANQCIELAPDWVRGYTRKVNALQLLGDAKGQMDACQRGLFLEPKNAVLKTNLQTAVLDRLKGTWWGTASADQGGYQQQFTFEGAKSNVLALSVLGREVSATYTVESNYSPMRMHVTMPQQIPGENPAVPHIFRFTDDGFDLCGPHGTPVCPTEFEGPGLVEMHSGCLPGPEVDPFLFFMSAHDKLVKFMVASTEQIPESLVNLKPGSMTREEMTVLSMTIEKNSHELQQQFGLEVVEQAMRLVAGCGQEALPEGCELSDALTTAALGLRNRMLQVSMVTEEALQQQLAMFKLNPPKYTSAANTTATAPTETDTVEADSVPTPTDAKASPATATNTKSESPPQQTPRAVPSKRKVKVKKAAGWSSLQVAGLLGVGVVTLGVGFWLVQRKKK